MDFPPLVSLAGPPLVNGICQSDLHLLFPYCFAFLNCKPEDRTCLFTGKVGYKLVGKINGMLPIIAIIVRSLING